VDEMTKQDDRDSLAAARERNRDRFTMHAGDVTITKAGGHHNPILAFTSGPGDWQRLLSDPEKHWRTGYSARTLAYSWEAADGFPPEVEAAFGSAEDPLLTDLSPLVAVPEFKVPLPGGTRSSQNDIFVLARSAAGPVCIMVVGKVEESFGQTLGAWKVEPSGGKTTRLDFLVRVLGLAASPQDTMRYQLLHRAASAVITAEQYRAVAAVLLIHSFSQERSSWSDYSSFTNLFGVDPVEGAVQRLGLASRVPLFGLWAVGEESFLLS
jgi:hypothetical protein